MRRGFHAADCGRLWRSQAPAAKQTTSRPGHHRADRALPVHQIWSTTSRSVTESTGCRITVSASPSTQMTAMPIKVRRTNLREFAGSMRVRKGW
ncbi:hypothetical protein ACIBH1_40640 [Nonomuraea sp. NPDC050663]|uniref:hypothetical protein n=1 Tax=Nonomuraea sp. NPDC050663 TaxID=3364370 RepID=UPI0037AECDC6